MAQKNDVFLFLDLPEHIQVMILKMCDFETLLHASETCKDIEELIFAATELNKRIVLRFTPQQIDDMGFVDSLKNGRVYSQVAIRFSQGFSSSGCFIMEEDEIATWEISLATYFKTSGKWIKELTFNGVNGIELTMNQLLSHCPNVKRIKVRDFFYSEQVERHKDVKLPKLKDLELWGDIMPVIETFANVTHLQRLVLDFQDKGNLVQLEDFIIRQDNLKHLTIVAIGPKSFFQLHRLHEIKFKLDSLSTDNLIIEADVAAKFFSSQTSLKEVKLRNFYCRESFNERRDYSKVIASVLMLPHLKSIDLGADTIDIADFEVMNNRKNEPLKRLRFVGDRSIYDKFLLIFPNLSDVRIRHESQWLDVELFAAENLVILDAPCIRVLKYQPESPPTDLKKLEHQLLEFISRHLGIQRLDIGHSSWQANNVGLSLRFFRKACSLLKELESIVVYGLPDIKELINSISGHDSLRTIEMLADDDSRKAFDEMMADDDFARRLIEK